MPKRALVTGAGRRLGRAMALALAEDGHVVAVHYAGSQEAAEEVVGRIEATLFSPSTPCYPFFPTSFTVPSVTLPMKGIGFICH